MAGHYDQLTVYAGSSNPELAAEICAYIRQHLRADRRERRENDVFVVQSFASPINDSIMEMLIMIDTLKRASAGRVTAVIPYYGYGRTDKKDQPRVPITARLVAKLVGVAGADRGSLLDLHAGQIQGFFDVPVDEMSAMSLTAPYFARSACPVPSSSHPTWATPNAPATSPRSSTRRWRSSRSGASAIRTVPRC